MFECRIHSKLLTRARRELSLIIDREKDYNGYFEYNGHLKQNECNGHFKQFLMCHRKCVTNQ